MPRQLRPGAQRCTWGCAPSGMGRQRQSAEAGPTAPACLSPRTRTPTGEVQGSPQDDDGYRVPGRRMERCMAMGQDPPRYHTPPVPGTTTVKRRFRSHKLIATPAGTQPVRRGPRRVSRVYGRPPSSAVAIFSCPKLQSLARCREVPSALITTGVTWARLYYAQLPFLFTRVLRRLIVRTSALRRSKKFG
jgi:hypothetical protein